MYADTQKLLRLTVCVAVGLALCVSSIAEEVTVSGTVLTPDGQPAAGAKVVARWMAIGAGKPDARAETTSTEKGSFSLPVLLNSDHRPWGTVLALKDGFGLGWQAGSTDDLRNCVITLNTESPLKGDVRADDGTQIPGATITVVYVAGETFGDTVFLTDEILATSDDAGAFVLEGLPAGRSARLLIAAAGYAHMRWNPAALGDDGLLRVTLQPEAVIAGTVTRDGRPVAGVRSASRRDGGLWRCDGEVR